MAVKLFGWLMVIILVIWAFSNPAAAGHAVHSLVTGLVTLAKSL